jgi:hypothetical protein
MWDFQSVLAGWLYYTFRIVDKYFFGCFRRIYFEFCSRQYRPSRLFELSWGWCLPMGE